MEISLLLIKLVLLAVKMLAIICSSMFLESKLALRNVLKDMDLIKAIEICAEIVVLKFLIARNASFERLMEIKYV